MAATAISLLFRYLRREFGIPVEDYPWIAERAAQNGSNGSNPREMGPSEYLELLNGL